VKGNSSTYTKIDSWLNALPESEQSDFRDFCQKNYHNKAAIQDYLVVRGCPIALSTLYNWFQKNIKAGSEAAILNEQNAEYVGIHLAPLLDKTIAVLSKTAGKFNEILEREGTDLPWDQVIAQLPNYLRELRAYIELSNRLTNKIDTHSIAMQAGARVAEIVLNSRRVRDTPEEAFVKKELELALIQIKEELDKGM
jgi:hypothetical protein